ncbi:hypothetical protein PIB30_025379 [Stylosanthes scabra]|uniref:Uncharacterized protein n=1 Tax=Stylosanthes scabra TaxID=79078 RepID=A0ABU6ZBK8_9FABA|nr:hypothetical protein [Stylosanthes scabra]
MRTHSSYAYASDTHRHASSAYKRQHSILFSSHLLPSSFLSPNQMAPRKVYPPPSRFSRRLVALKARQARDEAGPANVAPHDNEVVEINSDSDLEQIPEYVPGEGAEIEEEDEEVPEYVPDAEPMGEEEDPEEDPEEDTKEDPEEEPEEDPEEDPEEEPEDPEEGLEEDPEEKQEEEPQEEQPEAMEQDEEEGGQEMAFGWANQEEEKEDINLLDHDDFMDYWEFAPPPSPASDDDDD